MAAVGRDNRPDSAEGSSGSGILFVSFFLGEDNGVVDAEQLYIFNKKYRKYQLIIKSIANTVSSLDSGHCRDLELVSSLVGVHTHVIVGVSFSQISAVFICLGFCCSPYYRSVCYSRVSARQELTVAGLSLTAGSRQN